MFLNILQQSILTHLNFKKYLLFLLTEASFWFFCLSDRILMPTDSLNMFSELEIPPTPCEYVQRPPLQD